MQPGQGFVLVELLIGLAVLGILAGVLATVVISTSRIALRATASLTAGRTLGSLRGFLEEELRNADSGDVVVNSATRVALVRPVGEAMPCATSDTSVVIAAAAWVGLRLPQAGRDVAWLLVDPAAGSWRSTAILVVGGDRCPVSGAPAIRLSLAAGDTGAVVLRVMEPVELRGYRSGIADWFGLAPAAGSSPVQPFAGPLVPGTTRWTLYADRLETQLQASGGPALRVTTPVSSP